MTFYTETYGNLVNGTQNDVPSFTPNEAAAIIARIEEKIRDLEVNLRRCSWGTTKHAQETAAGITKEISEYRRDIEQIKSQTVGEIPMSQQFTAGNGMVYFFVERLDYDGSNDKDVALYVDGVYHSYSLGFTFSEAKNRLWGSYSSLNNININTGFPL